MGPVHQHAGGVSQTSGARLTASAGRALRRSAPLARVSGRLHGARAGFVCGPSGGEGVYGSAEEKGTTDIKLDQNLLFINNVFFL
jgi:hypothetical protein